MNPFLFCKNNAIILKITAAYDKQKYKGIEKRGTVWDVFQKPMPEGVMLRQVEGKAWLLK